MDLAFLVGLMALESSVSSDSDVARFLGGKPAPANAEAACLVEAEVGDPGVGRLGGDLCSFRSPPSWVFREA